MKIPLVKSGPIRLRLGVRVVDPLARSFRGVARVLVLAGKDIECRVLLGKLLFRFLRASRPT